MKTLLVLGSALLLAYGTARAEIVSKCTQPRQPVLYSSTGCPPGYKEQRLDLRGNVVDTPELQRALEQSRLQPAAPLTHPDAPRLVGPAATAPVVDKSNTPECKAALRDYQIEAGSVAKDAPRIEGKRLAANIACGVAGGSAVNTRRPAPRTCANGSDSNCINPQTGIKCNFPGDPACSRHCTHPSDTDCVNRHTGVKCNFPGDPGCGMPPNRPCTFPGDVNCSVGQPLIRRPCTHPQDFDCSR